MKKKNIDIEAKLFMFVLNLKEQKEKVYSEIECKKNIVYIFNNYDEFKSYFTSNTQNDIDDDILEICMMKTTKKGNIIALKALCDYTITKYNSSKSIKNNKTKTEKQSFDILAVPCDRAFVVAPEKAQEFKNTKPNSEVSEQTEEMAEEFRNNNLGPVLKKTRKPNK